MRKITRHDMPVPHDLREYFDCFLERGTLSYTRPKPFVKFVVLAAISVRIRQHESHI